MENGIESIKNAANVVGELVRDTTDFTRHEERHEEDEEIGIGSRASAAKDALGDKAKERKHKKEEKGHKQAI